MTQPDQTLPFGGLPLQWRWQQPGIPRLDLRADPGAIATRALRGCAELEQRIAAAAWSAFERRGRGLVVLATDQLRTGIVSIKWWMLDDFAAEFPDADDHVHHIDAVRPRQEVLVLAAGGSAAGGGVRTGLLMLRPTPAPPEAHVQHREWLARVEMPGPTMH
jgi:hypothetical protein